MKVSEFCAQALVALEVLVHPRALPIFHPLPPNENSYSLGSTTFGDPKQKFSHTGHKISHDVYDFLNDIYMEDLPASFPAVEAPKDTRFDEKMFDIPQNSILNEPNIVKRLSDKVIPMKTDKCSAPPILDDKVESNEHDEELSRTHPAILPMSNPLLAGLENNISDAYAFIPSRAAGSGESGPTAKGITSVSEVEASVTPVADNNDALKMLENKDDDVLSDSFPDIVDADPDSSSEKD